MSFFPKSKRSIINFTLIELSKKNKVIKISIIQNLYGNTLLTRFKRTNKQYLIKIIEKIKITF